MNFYADIDPNAPLILIVSVIGITAILALGFVNVRLLFYAWIATLPFAQWSLYELGFMNIYMDRIIMVPLLIVSLFYFSTRRIAFSRISLVEVLMFGFSLICLISARHSGTLDRIGFGTLLSAYIYPFVAYYVAKSFVRNDE